jgi:hypothetical protein
MCMASNIEEDIELANGPKWYQHWYHEPYEASMTRGRN